MFGVGAPEALFIGLIALFVFGPGNLAEATRIAGAMLGKAQRKLDEANAELISADYPDEWFVERGLQTDDLFDERPVD
ncbi:Sec-independent protein translocase subunit TatA/TatB [Rubrobacter tropicus]|uniref:Sec-independent protein translocase subunit TatA/TatB n=1 Tax=Rubrobacter tropicus TaxID=2653851 RepID=UPI00140812B6|nr:twin-arginine translocase TatA/TatE family subunit [Rubrobacter tropicus]